MKIDDRQNKVIVAIDGPCGSGKTTVSREVAKCLGYLYLSTGTLYRAIALKACAEGIDQKNERVLEDLIRKSRIKVINTAQGNRIMLDGADVTEKLADPHISMVASAISALPAVRRGLLDLQRTLGKNGGVVMEGRDVGTVVFPDAEVKIYLTANVEERGKRRFKELKGQGKDVTLEKTKEEIIRRDKQDSTRDIAPLKAAPDAIQVDTTHLNFQQVVDKVVEIVKNTGDSCEKK